MQLTKPQTIQIYCPEGDPRGIRVAAIPGRPAKVMLMPRRRLRAAYRRPELQGALLVFLVGEPGGRLPRLNISSPGDDPAGYLRKMNKREGWWQSALICTSPLLRLPDSDLKLLARSCYCRASWGARYKVWGCTPPEVPNVPDADRPVLADLFGCIRTLTTTLGYPLLESAATRGRQQTHRCRGAGVEASGVYTAEGFTVLEGSGAVGDHSRTADAHTVALREALVADGVLKADGEGTLIFAKDHIFASPCDAASVVLGRKADGWGEWDKCFGSTLGKKLRGLG